MAARPHAALALPQRERALRPAAAHRLQPDQPELHPRPDAGQQLRRAAGGRRLRRLPPRLGRTRRAGRRQRARGLRRRLHPGRHRARAGALRRRRGQPLRLLLRRQPDPAVRRPPPRRPAAQPHGARDPGRLPAHGPPRRRLLRRAHGRRRRARRRRQRAAVDRRPGVPDPDPHRRGHPLRHALGTALERRVRRLLPGDDRLVGRPRARSRARPRGRRWRCSCARTGW